jgi:tol-pal system protein YbgF
MNRRHHSFLALCFCCFLPLFALAQAPVVDDSENFALLEDQQAALAPPVAQQSYNNDGEDIALAQDNDSDFRKSANLLDQIKGMQQEIQELRGQVEVQAHELKSLQQQQLSFYKDIDTRLHPTANNPTKHESNTDLTLDNIPTPILKKNESLTTPTTAYIPVSTSSRMNPADEQISYLKAYDLVKNKRFDDALLAMKNFVTTYPRGGYTANAHYWLGELYMVKKEYNDAIAHFEIVLKQFSSSSKAAACSLKIGYALAASGKKIEAKKQLQQVVTLYPDTPTAQLAASKLKTLNAI